MALTKQDVQTIRELVRDEVSVQQAAYSQWLDGARTQITEGLGALARGERTSPARVFAEIRRKQAKRRERTRR